MRRAGKHKRSVRAHGAHPSGVRLLAVGAPEFFPSQILRTKRRPYVETVPTSTEALERVARQPYDAVLYHKDAAGVHGFTFLTFVRSLYPSMPLFVLTDEPDLQYDDRARELGATEIFPAPKSKGSREMREIARALNGALALARRAGPHTRALGKHRFALEANLRNLRRHLSRTHHLARSIRRPDEPKD